MARHRRKIQNCHCFHCQNHNKYIQNQSKNHNAPSSYSPNANLDSNLNGQLQTSAYSYTMAFIFPSTKSMFNFNEPFPHEQSISCKDMRGKDNSVWLNPESFNYPPSCSITRGNQKFLMSKEEFKKTLSDFLGALYE